MRRKKDSAAQREEAQARASVRDQIAYEYPQGKNGPGSPPAMPGGSLPAAVAGDEDEELKNLFALTQEAQRDVRGAAQRA